MAHGARHIRHQKSVGQVDRVVRKIKCLKYQKNVFVENILLVEVHGTTRDTTFPEF